MTKRLNVAAMLAFIIILLSAIAVIALPHTFAYAEEEAEIAVQPVDGNLVYGAGVHVLRVTLTDPDLKVSYAWYKSASPETVGAKVAEGEGTNPSYTVARVGQSGYYRCIISRGEGQEPLASEVAYVTVAPKPVEVTVDVKEMVYDGTWKKPEVTVKKDDIKSGDILNAYVETPTSSVNAGTYVGEVKFDNSDYSVKGDAAVTFTVSKASLTVKAKEKGIKAGQRYEPEIEYVGLVPGDSAESLGFTPAVSGGTGITSQGVYEITCSGPAESVNYKITYEKSRLFVNGGVLAEDDIEGIVATAGGSFRVGTKMTVTEGDTSAVKFPAIVKYGYKAEFVSGGADGESYMLNIQDDGISKLFLGTKLIDAEGNRVKANYSYRDGVLSVSVPTDFSGTIVIYNDYTVLLIAGAVIVLVVLFTVLGILRSKAKYRRDRYYYEAAEKEADKWRPRIRY